MKELTTDLRLCTCECGCGMTFMQRRVGRVRKYIDKTHKAHAQKVRDANRKTGAIGDIVAELMRYVASLSANVDEEEHTGLRMHTVAWLQACDGLFTEDTIKDALNDIQGVYMS